MVERPGERPAESGRTSLTTVGDIGEAAAANRRRAIEVGVASGIAGLVAAVMLSRGITGLQSMAVGAPVAWIVAALAVRALTSVATEAFLAHEGRRDRVRWFGVVLRYLAHGGAGAVHDVDTAIDHIGEEPTIQAVTGQLAVAPVGLIVVFLVSGWLPTVIVVGLTVLAVPAYIRVGRQSAAVAEEFQRRRRSILVRQLDMLRSVLDLRALGAVAFGADEIAAESDAEHRAIMSGFRVTVRSTLVSEFLGGVTVGLVAMVVGLGLWHHEISLMRALVAVLVTAEMGSWLRRYGGEFHRRDDAREARRVLAYDAVAESDAATPLLAATAVTTEAPAGATTFSVTPGDRLVISGPSGVGKTLLLEAALGLRPPASGQVCRTSDPIALIRTVNHFVDGSVRDNLTLGATSDDDAVERVCAELGLDSSILDREAGSDGGALSTGEGVLVSVARGVAARARLFVLDDVAGSLDEPMRRRLSAYFDAAPDIAVVEAAHDVRVVTAVTSEVRMVAT